MTSTLIIALIIIVLNVNINAFVRHKPQLVTSKYTFVCHRFRVVIPKENLRATDR